MSDEMQLQKLWKQISDLSLETTALSFFLVHLAAAQAKASPDSDSWLTEFSAQLRSSITTAPDGPEAVRAHLEQLNERIDFLIKAVGLRLSKQSMAGT